MHILSIGSDRNIFKKESAVRERVISYGKICDELHVIVFAKKGIVREKKVQIAENVWAYPTNSFCKLFYVRDAVEIGRKISRERNFPSGGSLITTQDPFESGLAGLRLKKKTGFPLNVQIHTDFLSKYFKKESFLNRFRVFLAKKILPNAETIRVVSEKIKKSLEEELQIKDEKIKILPIFTDILAFQNSPSFDFHGRYPEFSFVILMASRITREKNFPLAFRALQIVLKKYPRTGLVVIGEGREKWKLQIIAFVKGLRKNIFFLPWQKNLAPFYKSAKAFLLSSNYEGYGMTLVEAASSGTPIVTTDIGIASEFFKNGESALICSPRNADCLAEKIIFLIEHSDKRILLKEYAFNEVCKRLPKNMEEYLLKYKEIWQLTIEHK